MLPAFTTRHHSIVTSSSGAPHRLSVVAMGGQGARRKRNWRHNRPNSPYKRWLLHDCPGSDVRKHEQDEAQRQLQARELQQPGSKCDGYGNQQQQQADDDDC